MSRDRHPVDTELDRELEIALDLARRAGALALAAWQDDSFDVERKADDSPVTSADRRANALICTGLREAFPGDAVVGEESDRHGQRASRTWFVDPIDGTKEFIAGRTEYSVMIGLIVDNAPALGVVYRPATRQLYAGVVGHGAWLWAGDEAPVDIHVSDVTEVSGATMMRSRSHPSAEVDAVCMALGLDPVDQVVAMGSIGLKLAQIAAGRAELYLNLSGRSALWDAAGPHALLAAAGGQVSDAAGLPIDYEGDEIMLVAGFVATSGGALHRAVLDAIVAIEDD